MKRSVISDRALARKRGGRLLGRSIPRLGALAFVLIMLVATGELAPVLRALMTPPLSAEGLVLRAAPIPPLDQAIEAPPPLAIAPMPRARRVNYIRLDTAHAGEPAEEFDVLSAPELSVISQARN